MQCRTKLPARSRTASRALGSRWHDPVALSMQENVALVPEDDIFAGNNQAEPNGTE